MWELDHKQSQVPKNWCFYTVELEKTLENPLVSMEIKPVNPKGNQSWIFIWRTDAEAETPILWPTDAKSRLIRKDPDAGKYWGWEEKGTTEDEMVGWHHWLNGHEFEQALRGGDWQGSLASCSPWGRRVKHNWATELNWYLFIWLHQVLVVPCRVFSCNMEALVSWPRIQPSLLCLGHPRHWATGTSP